MGNLLRALVVLSLAPAAARAESPDLYMELHGSTLDVTVVGAAMQANELALSLDGKVDAHALSPLDVRSYAQGSEAISIMFVVSGQEVWMGNDAIETDPKARVEDAIGPLEFAIDSLDLDHRLPPASEVGFVTYAKGTKVPRSLAPLAQFETHTLGTQHDYYNKTGSDLAAGISKGLDELERESTPLKMMIVVGDGNDTKGDDADPVLAELKKRAAYDHVALAAMIYKQRFSPDTNQIVRMIPSSILVSSTARFHDELDRIIERATRRVYAQFDVGSLPVWDGHDHDLVLMIAGRPQESVTLNFPNRAKAAAWWRSLWFQVLAGLLGIATLALLARRGAR